MPQYLARKGNTYYFRQAVPKELHSIVGKREIKKSLGRDFAKAVRECKRFAVQADNQIADARAVLDGIPLRFDSRENIKRMQLVELAKLTPQIEQRFANYLRASLLDTDIRKRMSGLDREEFAAYDEEIRESIVALRRQLAMGQVEYMFESARILLVGLGYDPNFNDEDWRRIAYVQTQATLEAYEGLAARQRGDIVNIDTSNVMESQFIVQSQPAPMLAPNLPTVEWRHLFDAWVKECSRSERTRSSYEAALTLFQSIRPLATPLAATREDGLAFRDYLLHQDGLHHRTVSNKVGFVATIFNSGLNSTDFAKHLGANPFANIKVKAAQRGRENDDRQPFNDQELKVIFGSRIYTEDWRPKGGAGEAAAWIPALAYLSGANLDELAMLRVDQFHVDAAGNHYFQIGDGKNSTRANREVPIHPALIEAGLLEYVKTCHGRLFPQVKSETEVQSAAYSKWFGHHLDRLKITSPSKVFHSFRHLFKDLCRNAGLETPTIDQICGHEPGTVGGRYGNGKRVDVLAQLLATVVPPVPIPKIRVRGKGGDGRRTT